MRRRALYGEGDWFAVPLRTSGFGVGIIARAGSAGRLVGYFFGPRRERVPSSVDEVADLRPEDAVLVARFGYLGLRGGSWPVIGTTPSWDRAEWPMPVFVRYEELTGRSYRVIYSDDDPGGKRLREERIAPGTAEHLPSNDLKGDGSVEITLTNSLG